ncbi:MAG: hypothetical protein ACI8X5_002522 [Planctomycetota bacterium]|jgi:hypothetical protein
MWVGPFAVLVIVAVHLLFVAERSMRQGELMFLIIVGLFGMLADTGLGVLGATRYPSSEAAWPFVFVPPFITSLWVLFATLPHHSLSWLRGRPVLAVVFGMIGGPLSFMAGTRFGAVGVGDSAVLTYGSLAIEYGVVMPLLLSLSMRRDVSPNGANEQ